MRRDRLVLAIAAAAIGFAAADTYVVVMALPAMMTSAGLSVDELQRAAPIVSGFLLGYVGVLPLIGRVSDLRGRVPVLLGSLVVFTVGSVITAGGYDLAGIVTGRLCQGIGGGGLIPPTLALIADQWPAERRGLPLGIVGAVQEFGSVLGPLLGAAILELGSWHDIFWTNAGVGLVLAVALWWIGTDRLLRDGVGWILVLAAALCLVLVLDSPDRLTTGVTSGLAFLPVAGDSRWLSPLALVGYLLVVLFVVRQAMARRPLLDWRGWREIPAATDVWGAVALTVGLGAVIVSFASANPEKAAVSADAVWLLPLAAACAAWFARRQRTAANPLVPRGALANRPARASLAVSFLIGGSLIAAVVDIPVYARTTRYPADQFGAAMVLLRFLVAVPIGAVVGGWLLRRFSPAPVTTAAMTAGAVGFALMSRWDAHTLDHWPLPTLVLAFTGLGFGLAIAPVNAALLDHTEAEVHGVASALLVVARMVGMLLGISALTAIGLRAFERATARIPAVEQLCGGSSAVCTAYKHRLRNAGIDQVTTIFLAAAVVCVTAAVVSVLLGRRTAHLDVRLTT